MSSTNKNLRERIEQMERDGLSAAGRFFLQHAKTIQGDELQDIELSAAIDSRDDLTTPIVRLKSALSRSERMRRFGVQGLQKIDWAGERAADGTPIPSEKYIADMVVGFGDDPECRTYELRGRRGETLAAAINRAGAEIRGMIESGGFVIA